MGKDNVTEEKITEIKEVEEKIKRLNYLEQLKLELETQNKPKKSGLFPKMLLLLLVILCSINVFGHVYIQNQYSLIKRDITLLQEDISSAASEVREIQKDQ